MQTRTQLTYWKTLPLLCAGVSTGAFLMLCARMAYYNEVRLQPAMNPQVVFYFLPALVAGLLIVAIPLEVLLRRIFFLPENRLQVFISGMLYASFFSIWAFPPHWYVVIILNPFLLRWLLSLQLR